MCLTAYSQDIDFHITDHFLQGKTFIKIKQDFYDPYVWALTDHNGVYRINVVTKAVDDLTADFAAFGNLKFIDIAGRSKDTVFHSIQKRRC
ncbi:hypothetical protein [Mucilaginibacter sp. L3T2-6]|uniref:hypothetical protein n=1 Tax=Mucilaginibacter sp. L3T2-6 TaxID=3062491 RepID=UPI002676D12B|nr:hypothetical protein [Mucilaginibacter sp. L3T2-6]MDO3645227.1 hypothetical protein [Mucilaginibacter sp. L3T2-6]MDV6217679.1 hypothetical protein [Mucilaginibacter sp. L3T2-6]